MVHIEYAAIHLKNQDLQQIIILSMYRKLSWHIGIITSAYIAYYLRTYRLLSQHIQIALFESIDHYYKIYKKASSIGTVANHMS